jgi:hypothetical protein
MTDDVRDLLTKRHPKATFAEDNNVYDHYFNLKVPNSNTFTLIFDHD